MSTFKELILSFFESSKERLRNPVVGTFIIAWSTINWRFLAILVFSSKAIEQRIDYIEECFFDIKFNFWFPLSLTAFYILLLPYLMAIFDWIVQYANKTRKLILTRQRISDLHHKQEIAAEEWQLQKIKDGSRDTSDLSKRVIELERSLKEREDFIKSMRERAELNPIKNDEDKPNVSAESETGGEMTESISSPENQNRHPILKDIIIRDLPKTEREWILIFALYSSNFGEKVFTREDLSNKYNETSRKTGNRLANLSNHIKGMVKAGQIKFINDNEMLLTSTGKEMALGILNR